MKNLTAIQKERVRLFKQSLDPKSKWYNQDLQDFIQKVAGESVADSERIIGNVNYMKSEKLEREVAKEENKMLKAGLYNVGNMKPINALD